MTQADQNRKQKDSVLEIMQEDAPYEPRLDAPHVSFNDDAKEARVALFQRDVTPHLEKALEACRLHGFNYQVHISVWQKRVQEEEEKTSIESTYSSQVCFHPDEVSNQFLLAAAAMDRTPDEVLALAMLRGGIGVRLMFDTIERRRAEAKKAEAAKAKKAEA